jgi:hypothetical protein
MVLAITASNWRTWPKANARKVRRVESTITQNGGTRARRRPEPIGVVDVGGPSQNRRHQR